MDDSNLHKLYISQGKTSILSDLPKIIYATIISSTIKNLLLSISFPEKDILLVKSKESQQILNRNQRIQKAIIGIIVRCYLFFFISIFTLFIFWFYIASFFTIFKKTQLYVIKNALISFGISLVYPFFFYLIPVFMRNVALKEKESQGGYCLYYISLIFQSVV